MIRYLTVIAFALLALTRTGEAEDLKVGITSEMQSVTVETSDGPVEIRRIQDQEHEITGEFARTSRACPPFCIQPISPAEGVTTIGEVELIDMLKDPEAIVVDSRTVDWFRGGSIPGAINLPYTETGDRLSQLGCEPDFDGWDCENARKVALFCNGLWCGQSPTAIRAMIAAGYPADRIFYYRGGMQSWRVLLPRASFGSWEFARVRPGSGLANVFSTLWRRAAEIRLDWMVRFSSRKLAGQVRLAWIPPTRAAASMTWVGRVSAKNRSVASASIRSTSARRRSNKFSNPSRRSVRTTAEPTRP